jgi:hypothetical protein
MNSTAMDNIKNTATNNTTDKQHNVTYV